MTDGRGQKVSALGREEHGSHTEHQKQLLQMKNEWGKRERKGLGSAAGCYRLCRSALLYVLGTAGFWTSRREEGRAGFGIWLTSTQDSNMQLGEEVINSWYMPQHMMPAGCNAGECGDTQQPPCCAASSQGVPWDWRQAGRGTGSKAHQAALPSHEHLVRIQLTAPMEGDTSLPGLCILHLLAES